jgi:hypothetical protein
VGAASDYFHANHPHNSLQLAFWLLVPCYFVAIAVFLWLARILKKEALSNGVP